MPAAGTFTTTLYSPQNRAERLIILGRVVLAAFALFAIWLDPSTPANYAQLTYTLLIVYLGYALLLIPVAWRPNPSLSRLGLITHIVDLSAFTVFLYLTEGPSSLFFVYFLFFLLAATLRWQWRGTLWTALATLAMFVGMGIYTLQFPDDPAFELNRFIIRSVNLAVVAMLLGYLGVYEQRLRGELAQLAAWSRDIPADAPALTRNILKDTLAILDAPRGLLIWEEAEEPWCYLAVLDQGEFLCTRHPPGEFGSMIAEPLAASHFLCLHAQAPCPAVLHTSPAGLQRWQGAPIHDHLLARFAIRSVLALQLHGETVHGRLLVLDKADMTSDELLLGEIVARQAADDMEQFYARQRVQQTAAVEERMRLARDLHDGLLQSLASTVLHLDKARDLLKDNPQAADKHLADLQALLVAEQRDLRAFVQRLKPGPADATAASPNLIARLEDLGRRVGQQWNLRVELTVELAEQDVPRQLREDIYHLVQEALANAARHAHATTAGVRLAVRDGHLHIRVTDDGCGFPFHGHFTLAELMHSNRGPVSLKARVSSLGGALALHSTAGGARLEIALPLKNP